MKNTAIAIIVIVLIGCGPQNTRKQASTQEDWCAQHIDSTQVLLTNDFKLNESSAYGASSFLIKSEKNIFLCTAKHLMGEAMGIVPEVKPDSFNASLEFWNAFPRQEILSDDTIKCLELVNEKNSLVDIILLKCELPKSTNLQVLKPRFSVVKEGERLTVIGCEYADVGCYQKRFDMKLEYYDENKRMIAESYKKFAVSGFSGAPVVDDKGLVVGGVIWWWRI